MTTENTNTSLLAVLFVTFLSLFTSAIVVSKWLLGTRTHRSKEASIPSDTEEGGDCEEDIDDPEIAEKERNILEQFPWISYQAAAPAFKEVMEATTLQAVLPFSSQRDSGHTPLPFDMYLRMLRNDPAFRMLFLDSWQSGSFEAIRTHDQSQLSLLVPPDPTYPHREILVDQRRQDSQLHDRTVFPTPVVTQSNPLDNGREEPAASQPQATHVLYNPIINEVQGDSYIQNICDEESKIMDWLWSFDPWITHTEISRRRVRATGKWFQETLAFQRWLKNPYQRVLWCPGPPGVGKTFIASTAIDSLQSMGVPVFFIYFSNKAQNQQDLLIVLRSLSRQMHKLCRDHQLPSAFEALYASNQKNHSRLTQDELVTALSCTVKDLGSCYIILDALDEYMEHYSDSCSRELLETLLSLGETCKVLALSRTVGDMEAMFEQFSALKQTIVATDEDVEIYLRSRIATTPFQFEISDNLASHIIEKVRTISQGRFLVVELNMNSLTEHLNAGDLRDALEQLPGKVDDTYARIMSHIQTYSESRKNLAMKVLMWITCTIRPLKTWELQYALATKAGRESLTEYITPMSTITSVCAGLVVVENDYVVFAHNTAEEYFREQRQLYMPSADQDIVLLCLHHLRIPAIHQEVHHHLSDWGELRDLKYSPSACPFYDYAALNWGRHAGRVSTTDSEPLSVETFSFMKDVAAQACLEYVLHETRWQFDTVDPESTGIFLAVYHAQYDVLSALLAQVSRIPLTREGRTPLSLAARIGDPHAAQLVLDRWQQIDPRSSLLSTPDKSGSTPLSYAAQYGHNDVVQLLLKQEGIEADLPDRRGWTPAMHAVRSGHLATIEDLLRCRSININRQDKQGRTMLADACHHGHEDVVRLLLRQEGIQIDLQDNAGLTALMHATRGHQTIARMLLDQGGLDIHLRDTDGWTALSHAAHHGQDSIVQMLLQQREIYVDSPDAHGYTPFMCAAEAGHITTLKLLLAHKDGSRPGTTTGVNVNAQDQAGHTALWLAAMNGNTSIVQFLLQNQNVNVHVDPRDSHGTTPLLLAAELGHLEISRMLLSLEADCTVNINARDGDGDTPLTVAAKNGHAEIVSLLLGYPDAEVNFTDNGGRSPLSYAASADMSPIRSKETKTESESLAVVRVLLSHPSVDVSAADHKGKTPLDYSMEAGFSEVTQIMRSKGAV